VAFAPIVMFLCGVADVIVPSKVLITSVVVFIVIPLVAGFLTRKVLLKSHGTEWFEKSFLPRFQPVTVVALLATLVLIFAFQAENLTTKWTAVILLAIPILVQVYFNSSLTYLLMRWFKVPHNVASPGALSSVPATSSSLRWPWPSPCSAPARARLWPASWGCWSKCL